MSPALLPTQLAAVLHGPRDIRVETRPVWPPQRGQVQVQVEATGLCGSDLHYYLHARNADFTVKSPLCLGHESAGTITAVGPEVTGLTIGQRVAIEPGIRCNNCDYCSSGRYNLCKGLRFCSSAKTFPHADGTLQEKFNHPSWVVHPLPAALPLDVASLAEPLSVLLHAASRAGICQSFASPVPNPPSAKGKAVLVFGVGTIGILAAALAKSLGATKVCAIDIDPKRLQFAQDGGWVDSIHCLPRPQRTAAKPPPEEGLQKSKAIIEAALERFDQPDGFDIAFECTGAEPCIQMAVYASTPGSKVMLVGMGSSTVTLPLSTAALREVDLVGCFRYAGTWKHAVELLDRSWRLTEKAKAKKSSSWGFEDGGLGDVSRLLTHRFPLDETKNAFELMAQGRDDNGGLVLKVVIERPNA